MKPQELYDRKPESVSNDFNYLFGFYYNFIPEIQDYYGYINPEEIDNPRIEVKIIKYFDFDGRRFWQLATVWFASRFVTDEEGYKEMVKYVKTLLPVEVNEVEDLVDPNEDIKDLETFYDNSLDGHFERFHY